MHAKEDDAVGLGDFWRAIVHDFRHASAKQLLALVAVVAFLIFEWGPGNETVLATSLASIIKRYEGLGGVALVTAAGFAMAFALQMCTGFVGGVGFAMLDRTTQVSWRALQRLRGDRGAIDWENLSLPARWGFAFVMGSSAVALYQQMTTGVPGYRNNRKVLVQSATLVGLAVMGQGLVIGFAAWLARRFSRTEPAADRLITIAANPLTWLALFALGFLIAGVRRRLAKSS